MWAQGTNVFRHVVTPNTFLRRQLGYSAFRYFSTQPHEVEEKILSAVRRYIKVRQEEVQMEMKEAKDKSKLEKYLSSMQTEVTNQSQWIDLGFDELDEVEVLLEIEEAFDHIIPDEISDEMRRVDQVIEYFQKQAKET